MPAIVAFIASSAMADERRRIQRQSPTSELIKPAKIQRRFIRGGAILDATALSRLPSAK